MPVDVNGQSTTKKRGRGRPMGSKTKNRIRDESILVPRPTRRPLLYNRTTAAMELGLCDYSLCQLENTKGGVYVPVYKEGRTVIYTDVQVRIMAFVLQKKMTPEKGEELRKAIEDEDLMDLARRSREAVS